MYQHLTVMKMCRTKTMFGHENPVPPKRSTRAEHHALIFFFLIFTYGLWLCSNSSRVESCLDPDCGQQNIVGGS